MTQVDILTARDGALNAALSAIQTVQALFPSEEWGDDVTLAERRCVVLLTTIEHDIDTVKTIYRS